MGTSVKVGIIGSGNIRGAYLKGCASFGILEVVACADIDASRAKARAEEFGILRACPVDQLLGDPEIQIVVNLTVPQAHTSAPGTEACRTGPLTGHAL